MKPPSAILAEDEPLVRVEIRDSLHALWPELTISAEVGDGVESLAAVERIAPDFVFLDIQMPGVNGLEVAQRISGRAHVVFISAFDQYAISAFEQGALDYVLKPISLSRLKVTVERLKTRLRAPPADLGTIAELLKQLAPPESPYLKWLTVPHGAELRVIAAAEIHRSVVVNVGAIDTIYRSFRGALEVKLKDRSELLPVSAAHTHLFKDSCRH